MEPICNLACARSRRSRGLLSCITPRWDQAFVRVTSARRVGQGGELIAPGRLCALVPLRRCDHGFAARGRRLGPILRRSPALRGHLGIASSPRRSWSSRSSLPRLAAQASSNPIDSRLGKPHKAHTLALTQPLSGSRGTFSPERFILGASSWALHCERIYKGVSKRLRQLTGKFRSPASPRMRAAARMGGSPAGDGSIASGAASSLAWSTTTSTCPARVLRPPRGERCRGCRSMSTWTICICTR
jgi:hypothetical protein